MAPHKLDATAAEAVTRRTEGCPLSRGVFVTAVTFALVLLSATAAFRLSISPASDAQSEEMALGKATCEATPTPGITEPTRAAAASSSRAAITSARILALATDNGATSTAPSPNTAPTSSTSLLPCTSSCDGGSFFGVPFSFYFDFAGLVILVIGAMALLDMRPFADRL